MIGDSEIISGTLSEGESEQVPPVPEAQIDFELLQLIDPAENETTAVIKTTAGEITVRFFPEEAPLAVENFLTLAESGYYNGVIIHHVVADFLIQSGDPTGTGSGGQSIYTDSNDIPVTFADEFSPNLPHLYGALAMANKGIPDSNGSQFFIVAQKDVGSDALAQLAELGYPEKLIEAYALYGGIPQFDYRYTVFGAVTEGMDVVTEISLAMTEGASSGRPAQDIVIESIEIIKAE